MANLTRRDPLFELGAFQDRFNQLFNQALSGWEGPGPEQSITSSGFLPPVDISEDKHSIKLQAELPGVRQEDLNVSVENNLLTITGERKFNQEENKENFHRIERRYGRFSRSFTLPVNVDAQNVSADFQDGVLNITLPKREESKARQITISGGKPTSTPPRTSKEKAA